MSDQKLTSENLQKFVDAWTALIDDMSNFPVQEIFDDLTKKFPTPPLPTLADMTGEEREACLWLQADVKGYDERFLIGRIGDKTITLIRRTGSIIAAHDFIVTPRPDLPALNPWGLQADVERLSTELEEAKREQPALPEGMRLADHETYGRVVVSPDADYEGECRLFVLDGYSPHGVNWGYADSESLTFLDSPTVASNANVAPEQDKQPQGKKVLATLEDYVDARVGTVVKRDTDRGVVAHPVTKIGANHWKFTGIGASTDLGMTDIARTVIWEPEA